MDKAQLGDYWIDGLVGQGRMGIVFLATDTRTGRAVALKVLRDDVSADPEYRARFRREAMILADLDHPHIIPIHDIGDIDGETYIAQRLVCGTLRDVLDQGLLEVPTAVRVLRDVAEAVDAAHAAGVVHRDIKPANVLLDPGPRVYLGDFGLARVRDSLPLTVPGQVFGTLDYMAPEHLDGDGVGPAADIYAFACLAVETLTGEVPYTRATDAALLYAHMTAPPPSVSERRPDLPAALDEVVATGMAKFPEDRPASASALVAEICRELGEPLPERTPAAGC